MKQFPLPDSDVFISASVLCLETKNSVMMHRGADFCYWSVKWMKLELKSLQHPHGFKCNTQTTEDNDDMNNNSDSKKSWQFPKLSLVAWSGLSVFLLRTQ